MLSSVQGRNMRICAKGVAAVGQREGRKILQRQDLKDMKNERKGSVKVDCYLVKMPNQRKYYSQKLREKRLMFKYFFCSPQKFHMRSVRGDRSGNSCHLF